MNLTKLLLFQRLNQLYLSFAKHSAILSIVFIGITWQSCQFPKLLKENEYLLDQNKVKVNNKKLKEGIEANIKQKPNRKILGTFKFHLTIYRIGSTFKKANRFSSFLTNKVGEPPVVLDSTICDLSVKQIQIFLRNNGYYQSKVNYTVKTITVKKVVRLSTVIYSIETGNVLSNADVVFNIADSAIESVLAKQWKYTYIKTYEPFYSDRYIAERERLTKVLRNEGYYTFSKEYISYEVDSIADKAHIKMILKNPSEQTFHQVYKINNVSVIIDTLATGKSIDQTLYYNGVLYKKNGYKLNEELLSRGIKILPNMLYRQDSVEETYVSLVQIQLFKFVNIKFELADSVNYTLNCIITLSPKLKQDITWEPTLTVADQPNSTGISNQSFRNYGIANVFSYTNNNLLHKADIFKAKIRNTFEVQFRENNKVYFSSENSLNLSLDLPGRSPLGFISKPKNLTNISQISVSIIFEKNRDFDRRLMVMGYGYSFKWKKLKNTIFTWKPFELSYIRTENLSVALDTLLNKPQGAFLKSLFGKNFINSTRFSLMYSKNLNKRTVCSVRYTPIEVAGNLLNLVIQEPDLSTNLKTIFGVRFFSYAKSEIDARLLYDISSSLKSAFRFFGGAGIPYGKNTPNIMPYEKRYFCGGSNSLRGWRPRTLGPGNFKDVDNPLNRTGDMKLEANAEIRFPLHLYKNYFEGALFVDAGNIWNIQKDNSYPNAEFNFKSLADAVAIDAGFGLRLIFPFFIVRADAAVPLRDPSELPGIRYQYYKYNSVSNTFKAINLSFGIGYPF